MKKLILTVLIFVLALQLCACGSGISMEEAKAIALKDAGVAESDVSITETSVEKDLTSTEYEFRFKGNGKEWEYEIDGNGTITQKNITELSDTGNSTPAADPSASPAASVSTGSIISEADAKAIALKDAGVAENEVTFQKVILEYDDGVQQYEIEFRQGTQTEWEYEIDAATGKILKSEKDVDSVTKKDTTAASDTGNSASPAASSSTGSIISEADAKAIALKDAGVAENAVTFQKVTLEYDNGVQQYEIEFRQGTQTEWEYEIDAATGKILKAEKVVGSVTKKDTTAASGTGNSASPAASSSTGSIISEADAKAIALKDAGVAENAVTFQKVTLEYDNGVQQYEIEFRQGTQTEWEYEIDAATGKILKAEKDVD